MTDVSSPDEPVTHSAMAREECSVLAHDFNNLLLVIRGNCASLLKRAADDRSRDQLQQIDDAASAGRELTRRLLAVDAPATDS